MNREKQRNTALELRAILAYSQLINIHSDVLRTEISHNNPMKQEMFRVVKKSNALLMEVSNFMMRLKRTFGEADFKLICGDLESDTIPLIDAMQFLAWEFKTEALKTEILKLKDTAYAINSPLHIRGNASQQANN